jgi:hypothetical protein
MVDHIWKRNGEMRTLSQLEKMNAGGSLRRLGVLMRILKFRTKLEVEDVE